MNPKLEYSTNLLESYNAYLYSNPNAELGHKFMGYRNFLFKLNGVKGNADDFIYDNY